MTRELDFTLTVSRSRPFDYECEVEVHAVVSREEGEPGSLGVAPNWTIVEAGGIDENGNPADSENDQR